MCAGQHNHIQSFLRDYFPKLKGRKASKIQDITPVQREQCKTGVQCSNFYLPKSGGAMCPVA